VAQEEKSLVEGLRALSSASLLMLLAYILLAAAALLAPILRASYLGALRHRPAFTAQPWGTFLVAALVAVAGGVALYAILAKLSRSFSSLGAWKEDLRSLSPLAVAGLSIGVALMTAGIALVAFTWLGRWVVVGLAFLTLAVGYVGLGVLSLKLGTYLNSSTFTLAGAFAILSALVPLFAPVAWLVLYIESSAQAVKATQVEGKAT